MMPPVADRCRDNLNKLDMYPISETRFRKPVLFLSRWRWGFTRDFVRCTVAPGSQLDQGDFPMVRTVSRVRLAVALALVAASQLASFDAAAWDAGAAENLARHSGCNKCHAVEKKKDGPALRDV